MSTTDQNLDIILKQLGDFGKYQKINFLFIALTIVYSTFMNLSYVFTVRNIDYRCKIKHCDNEPTSEYKPLWLANAVPFEDDGNPMKCNKYQAIYSTNESTSITCLDIKFDRNKIVTCDNYVHRDADVTIVQDFDLYCEENLWKLTLVGTVNSIGQFVCLPIAGYISDRWGRRKVLVGGLLITVIFGIARSLSSSYAWFVILEFLDQLTSGPAYSSAFILAVELVGPEKRVLTSSLICSCYALGEIVMGIVASQIQSWRVFLQVIYGPGILLLAYFWITPESVRWLLTKGRFEEAISILRKAAKVNNRTVSEDVLQQLATIKLDSAEENKKSVPIRKIFESRIILLRVLNCSFCWITCAFVFYGLSLNSVTIAGDIYINFIASALIEIPAYVATYICLDKLGRRLSLCGALLISGIACFSFLFVPESIPWLSLSVYLLGKFGATAAFTITYVFTSEMFPTPLRHVLLGTCSTFGRIGSMAAPQTPLLANIWSPLPIVLFSILSISSGFLVLFFPETLHTKLPDTIEEAEIIGKRYDVEIVTKSTPL